MEQEGETPTARTQPPHGRDQLWIIPFVDDDEVRSPRVPSPFLRADVGPGAEFRIGCAEGLQTVIAAVLQQVGEAPRMLGFEHLHLVAACNQDRKSTRLNSSHANISYAVFCLNKKKK